MNYQKHKEEQMDMDRQDIKKLLEEESAIVEANKAEIERRKQASYFHNSLTDEEMKKQSEVELTTSASLTNQEIEHRLQDPYGAHKVMKQILDREMVNHPDHYQGNKFEVIDVIEDYDLGFSLGNAIKYILRADKKGNRKQDLEKAIWYIQREIKREDL
jgi:hypothetical protein